MPRIITNLFGERMIDYSNVVFVEAHEHEDALHPNQLSFDDLLHPHLF